MGHRILMLAAIGLASLYTMHLLAQDYMKIQRIIMRIGPQAVAAATKLFRGKRDIEGPIEMTNQVNYYHNLTIELKSKRNELKLKWEKISKNDPFGCIPSFICQISAGAGNESKEASNMRTFLELTYNITPRNIQNAYNQGLMFSNNPKTCYSEYPLCIYSANTMLKILKWFIGLYKNCN